MPVKPIDLSQIPGMESVKRVLELTLVADLRTAIVGRYRWEVLTLCQGFNIDFLDTKYSVTLVPVCECQKLSCSCSPESLVAHKKSWADVIRNADIISMCPDISLDVLFRHPGGYESTEVVKARIHKAKDFFSRFPSVSTMQDVIKIYSSLDESSKALLKTFMQKLELPNYKLVSLLKVAMAIASTDRTEKIRVEHIAEACQYLTPFNELT